MTNNKTFYESIYASQQLLDALHTCIKAEKYIAYNIIKWV